MLSHRIISSEPLFFVPQVVSVLDPQLHSESQTFPLDYPSTLIFFRARGLSLVKACQDDGKVKGKKGLRGQRYLRLVAIEELSRLTCLPGFSNP